jgi:PKD repeat protein
MRIARNLSWTLLVWWVLCLPAFAAAQPQVSGLKIVVIAGEDSVNVIQQRTAVAPVVEVRDDNDQPVAGALVRFTVRGGRNARLNGTLETLQVTTDATGRATVTSLTPTGSGPVQMDVVASFQGRTATAVISQTNVATAAAVGAGAAAGTAGAAATGAGGGGGLSATTIGILGGAAAGGTIAAVKLSSGGESVSVQDITATPAIGLMAATTIQFEANVQGTPSTFQWSFGDGATGNGASVSHVYQATGVFTARLTATDGDGNTSTKETTVTIKSLTGRWSCLGCPTPTVNVYTLTQSGSSFSGTYLAYPTNDVLPVGGNVKSTSPMVTFTFMCPPNPGANSVCGGVISGDPDAAVDRLIVTYTPFGGTPLAGSTARVP